MTGRQLNREYIEGVKELLKTTPYFQLLGIEVVDIKPGKSVFKIPALTKHLNTLDIVHGGVFASILDATAFWAIYSDVDEGFSLTTVELKTNFLAPAEANQTLLATGTAVKNGRTLGLAEARLVAAETGRLVGFATSTCMIMKATPSNPFSRLPRKFSTS
jgi:uncharacterized protein (TIGR00369 family)